MVSSGSVVRGDFLFLKSKPQKGTKPAVSFPLESLSSRSEICNLIAPFKTITFRPTQTSPSRDFRCHLLRTGKIQDDSWSAVLRPIGSWKDIAA